VNGFVAASYFYNFNDPDGDSLGGSNATVDLLHPDSNSFSLDQLWLTISRDATEEQRAGFKADFVYGKTASILSGDNLDGNAGNDFDLYQGYVTYLAPIGEGVTISAGKFATLLGAEVAQANGNWNITRGNVYNFFQPINHMGLLASTPIGPITTTFGLVEETRSFPALNTDRNNNKAILFGVSGGAGAFSGSFAGTYGDSPASSNNGDNEVILDFIARDHDDALLEEHVELLRGLVAQVAGREPRADLQIEVRDSYRNMRPYIEKSPRVVAAALEAIRRAGVEPRMALTRGGTDGAVLSARGLPTPNVFTGGQEYHSVREWASVQDMAAAAATIVHLAAVWSEPA
jgi:hypothetical protein